MATGLTIKVTVDDFARTHSQLFKLLKALDKADHNGLTTRKLCDSVLGSKAYARKGSLIDQVLSMGYISREEEVRRPKGQVGNPFWTVNYITAKGRKLPEQLS